MCKGGQTHYSDEKAATQTSSLGAYEDIHQGTTVSHGRSLLRHISLDLFFFLPPVLRTQSVYSELTLTTIQLHIIGNHQHNLPLKDVIVHQSAADPGDTIVIGLHLLELAREHAPCWGGGHFDSRKTNKQEDTQ